MTAKLDKKQRLLSLSLDEKKLDKKKLDEETFIKRNHAGKKTSQALS